MSHRHEIHDEIKGPGSPTSHHWSIHELGKRLKSVDEGLVHEIGMADPSTIELIVSAEGVKAAFPAVIELVKSAPPIAGFKITAFRQRSPEGFTLHVDERVITDELLTYRLIQEGEELGLELFIDSDLDERGRVLIGFLSLDQRLGEYDVATA